MRRTERDGTKRGLKRIRRFAALWMALLLLLTAGLPAFAEGTDPAGADPTNTDGTTPAGPTVPAKPENFYVYDNAGVLSAETEQAILDKDAELSSHYGIEIVIMTFTTLGNTSSSAYRQFSEDIYSAWGIGGAEDRGALLILYTQDDNYDAVAGALGPQFTKAGLTELHQKYTEPKFATGDYNGAALDFFNAAADAAVAYIAGDPVESSAPSSGAEAAAGSSNGSSQSAGTAGGQTGTEQKEEGNPVLGAIWTVVKVLLVVALILAVLVAVIYIHGQMVRQKRRAARRNGARSTSGRSSASTSRRRPDGASERSGTASDDDYKSFSDRYGSSGRDGT